MIKDIPCPRRPSTKYYVKYVITYQATLVAKELIDDDIIRHNPRNPAEHGQCLENIVWEEIPARRAEKTIEEEPFTADTSVGTYSRICLRMQCVKQCTRDQIGRPNCRLHVI